MRKAGILWVIGGFMALWGQGIGFGAEAGNGTPEFKEVYDLVREHAGGITQQELDRAAVKGLLSALSPRVSLVTNASQSTEAALPAVVRSNLFDGEIAYVRIGQVRDGLPQ